MTQAPPALPDLDPVRRGPAVPAWDWLRRNRHVTVPMAVPPTFLAAGAALAHSPGAGIPTAAGAGALAASVWWAAPHKWDRPAEQWYARLSVAAAGGWLSAAALAGLHVPELIAAGPLALGWGIPWYAHKRARKHAAQVLEQWREWWRHYARIWDLAGSELVDLATEGVIDILTVQLRAGHHTHADIKAILPKLESALQGHIPHAMARSEVVKGNPSRVRIFLKHENPHDVEVNWDETLCPSSVTEPAPLGKDEAGQWLYGPLLDNWFIIGRKRTGKSNEASVLLASWTRCPDAQPPWIIDLKGGRSARPWAECADWIATTIEEARLLLGCAEAEEKARAELWYTGDEQAVPDELARALLVFIDEAHGVTSTMKGDTTCQMRATTVAAEGSATCVQLWVLTQYGALHESVGNDLLRGNLPSRMCFAVSQADHAQFALDNWKEADASKLENQGEFYCRIGPDSTPAPARGPHMPHPMVRAIAARNAQIDRPPLKLFCGDRVAYTSGGRDVTWQEVYDTRWDRLPASFARANLTNAAPPEAPVNTTPAIPAAPPPADLDWEARMAAIEDEVATIPDMAAPPPGLDEAELLRTQEGRMRLWARLLQEAPPGGIEPRTLNSAMSNSWTHLKLAALIDLGYVTKLSKGRYAPVTGCDIWEGLQRAEEAVERVAAMAGA